MGIDVPALHTRQRQRQRQRPHARCVCGTENCWVLDVPCAELCGFLLYEYYCRVYVCNVHFNTLRSTRWFLVSGFGHRTHTIKYKTGNGGPCPNWGGVCVCVCVCVCIVWCVVFAYVCVCVCVYAHSARARERERERKRKREKERKRTYIVLRTHTHTHPHLVWDNTLLADENRFIIFLRAAFSIALPSPPAENATLQYTHTHTHTRCTKRAREQENKNTQQKRKHNVSTTRSIHPRARTHTLPMCFHLLAVEWTASWCVVGVGVGVGVVLALHNGEMYRQ